MSGSNYRHAIIEAKAEREKLFKKMRAERLLICLNCPSMKRTRLIGLTCGRFMFPKLFGKKKTCGCALKWKVKIESEKCPQNKW